MASTAAALGRFCLLTAVFAVACCQAPLYYSNQHQYFLHGLARAGEGYLHDDWLASTRDPTPVFSSLVAGTVRSLHPWAFYLCYALLQGAYAAALLGVLRVVAGEEAARRRWGAFLTGLLLVHAGLLRWASYRWLGLDYPYYLQGGVAGQYVLGPVLQPSAFGVLLVVAVSLFANGRPLLAAACIGAAATVHSTYLLPGGLLMAGFLVVLAGRREFRLALLTGALALLLVLPVLGYVLVTFRPTSPETFHEAQDILVNFRIPHHCRPDLWLDGIAAGQIAWVAAAVVLLRRAALGWVLGVGFALAVLLTVAQVLTGNETLALLFPWRISTVLVPIATAVFLSRLVAALPGWIEGPTARMILATTAACLVAGGVWIMATRQAFQSNDNERGVLDHVRNSKAPGDRYFIPVTVPPLVKATRGSLSSDFKPLPGKRTDDRLIPVDLQGFRLPTAAPVFVDFKSIPYADVDVLEWHRRIGLALEIQDHLRHHREEKALALLRREGITHLLWPAGREPIGAWESLYEDEYYRVYRLPMEQ
jgi:hypothetical protein